MSGDMSVFMFMMFSHMYQHMCLSSKTNRQTNEQTYTHHGHPFSLRRKCA